MRRARLRWLAVIGALWVIFPLLGCASQNSKSRNGYVCERVAPTGTHIPRTYCWKTSEADQRREKDQETLRNLQIGSGINVPDSPSGPTGR